MKIRRKHIIIIFSTIVMLHIFANLTGMYETQIIWIDKVLHILAGIATGMIWLIILRNSREPQISKLINFMAILGFVLFVSVIWEITEVIFWKYIPVYAEKWNLYSPNIKDLLTDIVANLVGGILLASVVIIKLKSYKESK